MAQPCLKCGHPLSVSGISQVHKYSEEEKARRKPALKSYLVTCPKCGTQNKIRV